MKTTNDKRIDEMTHLELLVEDLRRRVNEDRLTIARKARNLAEDLLRVAGQIETDGDYNPSSLGIVQSCGTNIDRACAQLYEQRDALRRLEDAVRGDARRGA